MKQQFIDYHGHRPDARHRRIRPIADRAVEKQIASRGAKPDQSAAGGPIWPEQSIDAFRQIAGDSGPIGPQRGERQRFDAIAGAVQSGFPAIARPFRYFEQYGADGCSLAGSI